MTTPEVDEVRGAPADDQYNALSKKLNESEAAAGALLAQSFRDDCQHPDTARRMAEDYAREANESRAEMKAWRLANGWSS